MSAISIGIIGMGGFAGVHHDTVSKLETANLCKLLCACDPAMDSFAERKQALRFQERGVRLFSDYLEMLDACRGELGLVTIPTPIPLHAPMHRACVERGLPVYLEKPPTLDYAELEQMIAVDAKSCRKAGVGFNFIVEPERQELKRRLVAGEFGKVRSVSAWALWPRATAYFTRAGWAGRLILNGRLVLDSCIGNAMAHQVHNALFWCGTSSFWSWGEVEGARAEIYRAHEIEGLDTAFIDAGIKDGPRLRIGMTHACNGNGGQGEIVECELATINYHIYGSGPNGELCSVEWRDGRREALMPSGRDLVEDNFRAHIAYVQGRADRPMTTLSDSRPFVHLNNLAYVAAKSITTISGQHVKHADDNTLSVCGLPEAIHSFAKDGRLPSENGAPWAVAGGEALSAELPQLKAVVEKMAAARDFKPTAAK